ncbi:flagellar motor switch phosphatase FliY [Salirhabdus sp. Marseille-P4669]|uniref:flagellar motor switch phosphatase FliY n=1 Tax=Salirhabdus sp. Marseille-P4669 TaxID=2042310 RepID=UPI000C7B6371|nr:flagellar motor switch phosphatase FliY [Salirhabdus sp. Marseille-P4669]
MSDREMLSQEEIDALLNGEEEEVFAKHFDENPPVNDFLSSMEQDALGEIGNISFGNSATALSTLLNQKVDITTPKVSVVENSTLAQEFPNPHVSINVKYTEGFTGANLLIMKIRDAAIIADLMLGGDGTTPNEEMNEISLSAVQEAMNQMMGSAATSMSSIFNKRIDISPPSTEILDVNNGEGLEEFPQTESFIKISFNLKVGELIDSDIMQLLPIQFAKDLVEELLNVGEVQEVEATTQAPTSQKQNTPQQAPAEAQVKQEQKVISSKPTSAYTEPNVKVQHAELQELESVSLQPKEKQNLNMLLDIPLKVSVELGRTKKTIKDILEMGSGSIIELDKLAGEPVDIHVNDKLIAKGEVVVIDENFGVRVTDIISQTERIKNLN